MEEEVEIDFLEGAKLKASYIASIALAKKGRPFDDGNFLKEVAVDILDCFGQKGKEMSEIIKSIPLSRRTITRRTEDAASFLFLKTKQTILNSEAYALSLDESTDLNDTCQLILCFRTVNTNFEVTEGMLSLVAMKSNVTGEDIYDVINEKVFSFANKDKLSSICTDGAKVMVGCNKGVVGQLRKNNINVPTFHCILHQENLIAKSIKLEDTMSAVIQTIKTIRRGHKALTHRQFRAFLEEVDAEYSDILLYTEVRWLSKGKCLERFYSLRNEIVTFFEANPTSETDLLIPKLTDKTFLLNLAFFSDFIGYLCQLNLSLQGKQTFVFD